MLSSKNYCLMFITIFVLLGCNIFSDSPKEIYFRYYDFFKNVCSFNGNIEFQDTKSNYSLSGYQINYSKLSGYSIDSNIGNDSVKQIKIDSGKITITTKDGASKVYKDTEENRFNFGIPPGMGINPYYFLNTDLNKSKIKIFGENIEVTYKDNKIELREYIKISNGKIDKIQVFSGGGLIQEIEYQNFKKISKNIYYPMSYVQKIFDKGGSVIKSVKVVYGDVKISLCN